MMMVMMLTNRTSIFWAPEVINKHYEFLADVWAVGVVFSGLLDGITPER